MNIYHGEVDKYYTIKSINGNDEMNKFLLSLGCFEGEEIKISKKMRSNIIINIKGNRYGIDNELAQAIEIF